MKKMMFIQIATIIATITTTINQHTIPVMTRVLSSWIHMVIEIKKHKDKVKDYECRRGPFERFFVSSVEFCDAKHKNNSMREKIIDNKR
jgi:hypothetical protein